MEDKKSYYAIIPANIRYDKDICPNAKLLYGEITALCNEKGYCWANNKYFAELYGVSKTSVSLWIKQLVDKGYILSQIIYDAETKEIMERSLSLPQTICLNTPLKNIKDPIKENLNTPIKENLKDNNTSINNKLEYKEIIKEIVDYLNLKAKTNYRYTTKSTIESLNARLKEYSIDEIKSVIDKKCKEWIGTDMEKYLTPDTLFRPSNFEKYLNQKIIKNKTKPNFAHREYTEDEMNSVFDNLDDVEI